MVGARRVRRFFFKEDVGHVVTKAQGASAMSLVVNGVGRRKDYLISRWCDLNCCLHCGIALRRKQTKRRVCSVHLLQKLFKDLELLLALPTPQELVQQRDVLDPLAGLEEEATKVQR